MLSVSNHISIGNKQVTKQKQLSDWLILFPAAFINASLKKNVTISIANAQLLDTK